MLFAAPQVASTRHTTLPEGEQAEKVREMLRREAALQSHGARLEKLPPGTTPPGQLLQQRGGRGGRRGTPNLGGKAAGSYRLSTAWQPVGLARLVAARRLMVTADNNQHQAPGLLVGQLHDCTSSQQRCHLFGRCMQGLL